MGEAIRALLVRSRHGLLDPLRLALEARAIRTLTANNCAEAALALWSDCPPHMVFTEIHLADGNWADVLTLAGKAPMPVNVIIVAPFTDICFYLQVIERGAFDYIVPPLSGPELQHVIRIAAENAISRRRNCAPATPPAHLNPTPQPCNLQGEPALAGAEDWVPRRKPTHQ